MFETMFTGPQGLLDQIETMQRLLAGSLADGSPGGIRSLARGAFPDINVGRTPRSVEVFAFAPGLEASSIDLTVERNLLKISGARPRSIPERGSDVQVYANERPDGKFVRAVSLPDDADASRVSARYRDGVLRVSVALSENAQPRRIAVQ